MSGKKKIEGTAIIIKKITQSNREASKEVYKKKKKKTSLKNREVSAVIISKRPQRKRDNISRQIAIFPKHEFDGS